MTEIFTAAGAVGGAAHPREDANILTRQVLGILREVLEDPGLCDESKASLRQLVHLHRDHPERALYEHLRCFRPGLPC